MLKIDNITKIYKRGKHEVNALNNVSFTLPDSGFVFITGKSGCGKSTMLNLIGGLDNATSGDIICDGNKLSDFSVKDFDNYRNAYLGFVFQDFHLIDDLNVYQNIELSISLLGNKQTKAEEEKMIDNVLSFVDLDAKYKTRFVKELSGGQKQRVAIARALVKNPRLILADEPTGNLDSKTSKKVLEVLKKLSKDRLVVIVSHNLDDAKKYADRIIELADGEVISDTVRSGSYVNEPKIEKGVLTLPFNRALTKAQVKNINDNLSHGNIQSIKQSLGGFVSTKFNQLEKEKIKIEANSLSFKKRLGLAGFFTKKRWLATVTTTLITTLLVFILGLCQFFIEFDTGTAISKAIASSDEDFLITHKGFYNEDGNLNNNYIVNITQEEIDEFKASGYEGNIYPIYDNGVCITSFTFDSGIKPSYKNFNGFYIQQTYGTLQCDLKYLNNTFGINGQVEILTGDLEKFSYGLILTDYIADSMINQYPYFKGYSYNDLIATENISGRGVANCIIKTDYKEKYTELFDYFYDLESGIDRSQDEELMKEKIREFVSDVRSKYGLTYTINPNFLEDSKHIKSKYYVLPNNSALILPNGNTRQMENVYLEHSSLLTNNEIELEYDLYNMLLGKVYGYYTEDNYDTFEPITLTFQERASYDDSVIISKEVVVKNLIPDTNLMHNYIFASEEVFLAFRSVETRPYALYFDNSVEASKLYDMFTDKAYSVQSATYYSISNIGSIVEVFEDFFGLILVGLLAICTLLIISNAYRNIKKRYYEIGVLKALGAKTSDVGFMFSMQTILTGVIVCILSSIALITLCSPINSSILNALMEHFHTESLSAIDIIKFYPLTMLINVAFILIATTISCIIPIITIHKIKPNVIMQKDE